MRRILSVLLAAAMLLTLMTAAALADDPVKLTIAIPDKVNVEDYNTNVMTLQLEEELGIDIEFMVLASTDYATKINLMVQSGDKLPDAIICSSMSLDMIYSWAQEGALADRLLCGSRAGQEHPSRHRRRSRRLPPDADPAGRRNLSGSQLFSVRRQRAGLQALAGHDGA